MELGVDCSLKLFTFVFILGGIKMKKVVWLMFLFILLGIFSQPYVFAANPQGPADVNRDGKINWVDVLIVCAVGSGTSPVSIPGADVNQDGVVGGLDVLMILREPEFELDELIPHQVDFSYLFKFKNFLGDLNRDGLVNILDTVLVAKKWGLSVASDNPLDLDADNYIGDEDLKIIGDRFSIRYYNPETAHLVAPDENSPTITKEWILGLLSGKAVNPKTKIASTWAFVKTRGGR